MGELPEQCPSLLLCARLGYPLPGTRSIPEMIAQNKTPYYEALEAADASSSEGGYDVSVMEKLMHELLAAQLIDVVKTASGGDLADQSANC